ncbi:molybdenum cofactor sulfurase [Histomonas meleagridis]|uniref:molybdenum cofactor sulfurase n=1 Tax=Histomonas meleagridis TaxID=135588 RepID=UPI003559B1C5|nr:molybdenum cofactor sulfurase [Histomonas meleagridis]KAH0798136.1 molybdenum cofactor sulfurase [Histomonas meleagridis]
MNSAIVQYRKYRWVRYTLVGLLLSAVALLIQYIATFQRNSDVLTNILNSENYPEYLPKFREKYLKHLEGSIYLDYTGAGVYSDLDVERFRRDIFPENVISNQTKIDENKLIEETREELLSFLGTNSNDYVVVFLASATQALKLVGENYAWKSSSKFLYTLYNHNSVLGIRKYVLAAGGTFGVLNSSKEIVADQDTLYAVALEDNFAGTKLGKEEMYRLTHTPGITIIGDSSAFLPTNQLNLTEYPFDAVVLSFYKIIGFPNYGAAVLKRSFAEKLVKKSFLEGSVDLALSTTETKYRLHKDLPYKLEDDLPSPDLVRAAKYGLESIKAIGIENVNKHVWRLTQRLYNGLDKMLHSTNVKACQIYGNHELKNSDLQGGIVAFNIKKPDDDYVGYAAVIRDASKAGFHLRGGCHCNPGACFRFMGISEEKVKAYFDQKTTCGDNNDIVDGIPLGAVRASLGWASTENDVDSFLNWISENYVY